MSAATNVSSREMPAGEGQPVPITLATEMGSIGHLMRIILPGIVFFAFQMGWFLSLHGTQIYAWLAVTFIAGPVELVLLFWRLSTLRRVALTVEPTALVVHRGRDADLRFDRGMARFETERSMGRTWLTVSDGVAAPQRVAGVMAWGRTPTTILRKGNAMAFSWAQTTTTWDGDPATFRAIVDAAGELTLAPGTKTKT